MCDCLQGAREKLELNDAIIEQIMSLINWVSK